MYEKGLYRPLVGNSVFFRIWRLNGKGGRICNMTLSENLGFGGWVETLMLCPVLN